MKRIIRKIYEALPPSSRRKVKELNDKIFPPSIEPLMYRIELFEELKKLTGKNLLNGIRILEIGPRDGLDSKRLESLSPKEFVIIDLPERSRGNEKWFSGLSCPKKYIEGNFMYMPTEEFNALGKFDLIWFTGILYHNAEQMRMLRKLYRLLNVGGYLVMESATLRASRFLRNRSVVEICYPKTYRDTGTVTHLPTKGAIKSWLKMVGFKEIQDSNCYGKYNKDILNSRYACICKKNGEDESGAYYQKSGLNPEYRFGDSI